MKGWGYLGLGGSREWERGNRERWGRVWGEGVWGAGVVGWRGSWGGLGSRGHGPGGLGMGVRPGAAGEQGPGFGGPGGVQEQGPGDSGKTPGVSGSRAALTASLLPILGVPQSEELGARQEPHVAALR